MAKDEGYWDDEKHLEQDLGILEGWAAYLDLLKQRDELMWQGDKKEQTIKSNSDNDG